MITESKVAKLSKVKQKVLDTLFYAVLYSDEGKIIKGLHRRDVDETCCCGSDNISCVSNGISTYLVINGVSCFDYSKIDEL